MFAVVVALAKDLIDNDTQKISKKMPATDAVAIFAEGTFEDQVRSV